MNKLSQSKTLSAFMLIELSVVIAIIGVLAAISLPIYNPVRNPADKATCLGHLKQIVAASNLNANDNDGLYPNMQGYSWEPTKTPLPGHENDSTWMADVLAPYIGSTAGLDPMELLRCPAAGKNQQGSWLFATQYCHYRYNCYGAQLTRLLVGFTNAMLFFDTTYASWTANQLAHSSGDAGIVNVAYADGHVATLSYADFKTLDAADVGIEEFFTLGWTK